MTTFSIQSNVDVSIKGKPLTIIREVGNSIWQLEEQSTRRIREYSHRELLNLYAQRQLKFKSDRQLERGRRDIGEVDFVVQADSQLMDDAKLRRLYAKAVLGIPASKAVMVPIIRQTWEKLGMPNEPPHFSTVCRWRRRFLERDQSIVGIIAQDLKKGNRERRFPEEVISIANDSIDITYLTSERKTQQDALDHAEKIVRQENKLRPISSQLTIPTRRLIRSLISEIPAYDRCVARYGREVATKMFRSVEAHRTTLLPLERAEIDHTRLDIMVVDDETGMPLGRPWLSLCLDDFTRCILGLHVSFSPPSYLSVAKCIQHALLPKASLKELYPSVSQDWFCFGLMRELVVDNGTEFHSKSLESACLMFGIEIHYSPRKTPWFKGKVERVLGTLNRGVAHGHPGTTFSNIFEKGDYDPKKHAVVRLSALQEAIHIWVVDHYHQKEHRILKIPPKLAWENGIAVEDIRLPDNPDLFDAIVGKAYPRRLTHKGIEYNGLFYNSPELANLRRRHGEKLDVEIRVNPEDIGSIHVISPDKRQLFKVNAIAREYAQGLTEWQHELCKKYTARQLHKAPDPSIWLEAKEKIRLIFDAEKKWKKKVVRQQRASEKKARNSINAQVVDAEPKIFQVAPLPLEITPEGTPDIAVEQRVVRAKPIKRFAPIQQNRSEITLTKERNSHDE